ncbi:MAG TPA: class I SAM-dependent methyltransferase [Candidatus Limnocylindrales bacterium]|jgi:SAM-dependent methyltransferase
MIDVARGSATEARALARLYDVDMTEDPGDLDLFLALARRADGPILELGVGTGRLALALARAGYQVTGIDHDPAMLERARQHALDADSEAAGRLDLVEDDIRTSRLTRTGFRLGFVALNTLMLLGTRSAQRAAIRLLADRLEPGGIAVADVWQPDAEDLARFDGRVMLDYRRVDPETGRLVVKLGSAVHDAASQTVILTTIYDEGIPGEPADRWTRTDRLRLVSADELRGFAEDAGLEVELIAGGYDLEPIGPGSERAILIGTRTP